MNREWWLVEAGEYVLGTLRGSERELFEKLLKSDPEAQNLVMYWERQFAALDSLLDENTGAITPLPPHVWNNIEDRINDINNNFANATTASTSITQHKPSAGNVFTDSERLLTRKLQWWETIGALSLAACFALATVLITQWSAFLPDNTKNIDVYDTSANAYSMVSVLSAEDGTALWAIVADESSGMVRAIALDPPIEQPTLSHQLWVVLPDNQGVESVGLLPYQNGNLQSFELDTADLLTKLKAGEAFAISLEPRGGTSSAAPTGPVISSQAITRISEPL